MTTVRRVGPTDDWILDDTGKVIGVQQDNGGAQQMLAALTLDSSMGVTGVAGPDGNLNSTLGITNKMRKWQGALGKMRNGVRNAKLLMLGDSTGVGAGATGTAGFGAGGRLKTTPLYLASELNRTYYPANCHAVWG